jgi:serine/threonine protein kinase
MRCNMTKLNDLTTSERLFACYDVACALEEVHRHGTYHGDVRLSNLHFDQLRSCALSNFALHRATVHSFNGAVVPYWLSPESLLDGEYTEKSDSYSFAICIFPPCFASLCAFAEAHAVVWQMFNKRVPFEGMSIENVVDQVCLNRARPALADMPANLISLLESCWAHSAADRPSSSEIVEGLYRTIVDCTIDDQVGRTIWLNGKFLVIFTLARVSMRSSD